MRRMKRAIVVAALILAGCGQRGEQGVGAPNGDILANSLVPADDRSDASEPGNVAAPTEAAEQSPVDQWLGRWDGPEGLFLNIARHPGGLPRVQLTIKDNLDTTGTRYLGHVDGRTIRFTRGGAEQTIQVGTGPETGFKWLADKADCLIIVPGKEGYCRD
jgi:hypothetical protein